jgi:AraC family transcriptional regulator
MNDNIKPIQPNKCPWLVSNHQLSEKGILAEQYQIPQHYFFEESVAARSAHWLSFHSSQPVLLTQQHDTLQHESTIVQQGNLVLVPAGQATYWRMQTGDSALSNLSILLQPELIAQTAVASDLDPDRIELMDCFSRSDRHLYHIAMMLFAELQSGGIMGELYVESLTQVLVIHLLRHYSSLQPQLVEPLLGTRHDANETIIVEHHSLTRSRMQIAIDYIHAHLDGDLSMAQIAGSVKTSPTYFASIFKAAIGISLHQYVIQQRVERARLLLAKTDLTIADIASQVGFASPSHLTYHCKRLTGMTPKQLARSKTVRF